MSDDTTKRGPPDANRISLSEDYEVAYWTDALGVSRDELVMAVRAMGNNAAAVRKHLRK